jgi:hypothetical protein
MFCGPMFSDCFQCSEFGEGFWLQNATKLATAIFFYYACLCVRIGTVRITNTIFFKCFMIWIKSFFVLYACTYSIHRHFVHCLLIFFTFPD